MMPIVTGTVYELLDPRDGECRYVGKTVSAQKRKQQHESLRAHQCNGPYSRWKHELHLSGLSPSFCVIESGIPLPELNERERHWVRERSSAGFDLLNCRVGHIRGEDLVSDDDMRATSEIIKHAKECLVFASLQSRIPMTSKKMRELAKAIKYAESASYLFEPW